MAPSGQLFMCGPLSVEYMTKVLSAMPRSSSALRIWPTFLSWSIIASWYAALPAPRLPKALRLGVGAEVHVGEVNPDKHWLAGLVLALDEVHGALRDVIVDRLHPLFGQRTGVLAGLLPDLPDEPKRVRRIRLQRLTSYVTSSGSS